MLTTPKQYLYLVVDQTNKCVLANTTSASTANAVSAGIINSSPMVIWFPYLVNNHDIVKYNIDENINYKLIKQSKPGRSLTDWNTYEPVEKTPSGRKFDLIEMDDDLIDSQWIARRKLASFRAQLITDLEGICERFIAQSVTSCFDELLFPYLQKQLELSDPTNDFYSPGLQEWALINNVSAKTAYQELKMKYDSASINLIRVHAMWTKFVNKFNSISLEDNITKQQLFEKMETQFMFGEV